MTEINLKKHPSSNCKVIVYENGIIDFISYTTRVLRATPVGLVSEDDLQGLTIIKPAKEDHVSLQRCNAYFIECTGLYSPTTRHQIGWFLDEWFDKVPYSDVRLLWDKFREDGVIFAVRSKLRCW